MKTKDFLKKYEACCDGARWALSMSDDMADVWDAMVSQEKWEWLIWTLSRPGVFPESVLRKMACRFIRETPLADGRKVWNLLVGKRSRRAVEVAEQYADGKATGTEMDAAYAAACTTVDDADYDADVDDAAYTAAYDAARAADRAAYTAHVAAHAAYNAARAARASAYDADVSDAVYTATAHAAADAARAHANAALIKMIAEMGNPFRKG